MPELNRREAIVAAAVVAGMVTPALATEMIPADEPPEPKTRACFINPKHVRIIREAARPGWSVIEISDCSTAVVKGALREVAVKLTVADLKAINFVEFTEMVLQGG